MFKTLGPVLRSHITHTTINTVPSRSSKVKNTQGVRSPLLLITRTQGQHNATYMHPPPSAPQTEQNQKQQRGRSAESGSNMAALSTLSDTRVAAVVWRRCKGPEL